MSSARALEAPRPLKSTIKQQSLPIFQQQQQNFEVQSGKLSFKNKLFIIKGIFFNSRGSHKFDGNRGSISQSG